MKDAECSREAEGRKGGHSIYLMICHVSGKHSFMRWGENNEDAGMREEVRDKGWVEADSCEWAAPRKHKFCKALTTVWRV